MDCFDHSISLKCPFIFINFFFQVGGSRPELSLSSGPATSSSSRHLYTQHQVSSAASGSRGKLDKAHR